MFFQNDFFFWNAVCFFFGMMTGNVGMFFLEL